MAISIAPTRPGRCAALLLLALLSLVPVSLQAQQERIAFRHLSTADGPARYAIYSIVQDSLGFLWFGTIDGLKRYDGHQIHVFKSLPFDTTSISHPWVYGMAPAGATRLWLATEGGGLNRYDATTETFKHIRFRGDNHVSDDLLTLLKARDGTLWVGTRYDGLFHYDPQSHRVVTFRSEPEHPSGLADNRITALLEDRLGRIWIGTGRGGLNRFNPETGAWTRYRNDGRDPNTLSGDHVRALLEDRDGYIWVGMSPGGISRYRSGTDDFVHYRHDPDDAHSLGHDHVNALLEDPNGVIWAGTDGGLDRMDPGTGRFVHYRHDPADPTSLRPGAVTTLYLDRTGVFWVGTISGASYFSWKAPPFQYIAHDPDDPNSLDNPDVWAVYEDRAGMLWVGTVTGLNRVDRATGAVTRYPVDPTDPSAFVSGAIMGIYEDRAGNFWVGTRHGALHRFDRSTGRVVERFMEHSDDPASLKNDTPWNLFEDSRGRFWITSGGRGCLNRMDPATRTFRPYCHDPDDPDTPAHDIAHDLVESRSGSFWLGTWGGGLDRFDPNTGTFAHYRHDPTDLNTPASDFILTLYEDAGGILWLGFFGAGLDRFDPTTGTFTHFTEANSDLPNDVVLSIEEDATGDLWISTYQGLARFTPATGQFRNYGVEDGLQDLEFNVGASFRAPSGELFFGGVKGVNAFFPDRINDNPVPPPVVLTDLRIRGRPVGIGSGELLQKALPFTRSITLRHDQQDVAVTFAALHYADPARNRYRYRLEGYDDTWHEPGRERTATYTNLDPGHYTFRVQAANSDGVWNEQGVSLAVTIVPPWWRTWWAYTCYALLAGTMLYGFRRYEMNRLRLKSRLELEHVETEQLRELDRAKSQFFANVSHEFRTPLTLTLGPLDDLRAGLYGPLSEAMTEQVDLARRNAVRVLDLINQILEVARLEAGRTPLRARRLDVGAFVQDLTRTFVPLAERKAMTFDIRVPPEPIMLYADPEHLEKALANLLSNAFKFTPEGGTIRVSVEADAEAARVAVRDSGPGIPADDLPSVFDRFYQVSGSVPQLGTGIGLALAKEIVDLHGGTIGVVSEEGFGSAFTVTLRLGCDHLLPDQIVEKDEPWTLREPVLPPPMVSDGDVEPIEKEEARGDVTTVLVVEDNAEVRAYVRRHLVPAYRVIEAADGEQGLEKARMCLPDLVLSDVMMPKMDGFALCHALRSDPETDFIPIVLLTAKATPEDRLEGFHEHADDYLTKPFDVAELKARIENLIDSRRRLRARFGETGTATLHPTPVDVTSADAAFLGRLRKVVEVRLGDETFGVEQCAEEVGLSRSQLHRRLRELLDQSPSEAIRTMRLERAAQLLEAQAGTVSEVAYAVGFKSVAHFSNAFLDHYGCRPSIYPASE